MNLFTVGGAGPRAWALRIIAAVAASAMTAALWLGAVASSRARRPAGAPAAVTATTRITLPTVYVTSRGGAFERSLDQVAAGGATDCSRPRAE